MSYTVELLLTGLGAPVTVEPQILLKEAHAIMVKFGFSQLPVIKKSEMTPQYFLVTTESILRALNSFGETIQEGNLHVSDALIKLPRVYHYDDELFEMIGSVTKFGSALVVDSKNNLTHIVSSYDISQYLRQWAEDTMVVRDVEYALRKYINEAFKGPDGEINEEARQLIINEIMSESIELKKKFERALKRYLNKYGKNLDDGNKPILPEPGEIDDAFSEIIDKPEKIITFKDLSLDGYIKLFLHELCWGRCAHVFDLRRDAALYMLEGVRKTRNQLAHFKEDDITALQRDQLHVCADWLADHDKDAKDAFSKSADKIREVLY